MLALTKYKCEVCGKLFSSEGDAVRCESNHNVSNHVGSPEYQKFGSNSNYPSSVIVDFSNGERIRYYRTPGKRQEGT